MAEEIICTITTGYGRSAFLTSLTINHFSENPFYTHSRVPYFKDYFKKLLALSKAVPEKIQN